MSTVSTVSPMTIRVKAIGYETYEAYLVSDHWKEFSAKVRAKQCFCCNSRKGLQIHHITYVNLGHELPEDVVTVCRQCHLEIHDLTKRGTPLATAHLELRKQLRPVRPGKKKLKVPPLKPRIINGKRHRLASYPNPGEEWANRQRPLTLDHGRAPKAYGEASIVRIHAGPNGKLSVGDGMTERGFTRIRQEQSTLFLSRESALCLYKRLAEWLERTARDRD